VNWGIYAKKEMMLFMESGINKLKRRILEISYRNKLSHISSCISAVEIIDEIYKRKKENDLFILSNGHAGISLYTILEKIYGFDAQKIYEKNGVHPNNDKDYKIYCSTGSLGHGIGCALGFAFSEKNRDVYCLVSDGETFEGSFWECLQTKERYKINNFLIYVNMNGFSAFQEIDVKRLTEKLKVFCKDINIRYTQKNDIDFLKGINGHYHILNEETYKAALKYYA